MALFFLKKWTPKGVNWRFLYQIHPKIAHFHEQSIFRPFSTHKIKKNKVRPPTNIIIGRVVDLSDIIGWRK